MYTIHYLPLKLNDVRESACTSEPSIIILNLKNADDSRIVNHRSGGKENSTVVSNKIDDSFSILF